jgi:hypothetical protein
VRLCACCTLQDYADQSFEAIHAQLAAKAHTMRVTSEQAALTAVLPVAADNNALSDQQQQQQQQQQPVWAMSASVNESTVGSCTGNQVCSTSSTNV